MTEKTLIQRLRREFERLQKSLDKMAVVARRSSRLAYFFVNDRNAKAEVHPAPAQTTSCNCGLMVETHTTGDGSVREHKKWCAARGYLAHPAPQATPAQPRAQDGHGFYSPDDACRMEVVTRKTCGLPRDAHDREDCFFCQCGRGTHQAWCQYWPIATNNPANTAPAQPPKCAAKICFDGRDYTCGGKHKEADHNRLLGEAAAAGAPLDSPLIPVQPDAKMEKP